MPYGRRLYHIRSQALPHTVAGRAHLVDLVEELLRSRAGPERAHPCGQVVQGGLHACELRMRCLGRALDLVGDQARAHLDWLLRLGQG